MILPIYSGHALVAQLEHTVQSPRPCGIGDAHILEARNWYTMILDDVPWYTQVIPFDLNWRLHFVSHLMPFFAAKTIACDSLAQPARVLQQRNLKMGQVRHQKMHMPLAPLLPWPKKVQCLNRNSPPNPPNPPIVQITDPLFVTKLVQEGLNMFN